MMTGTTSIPTVQEVIRVKTSVVGCDGRSPENHSGHPLVYLNIGEEGRVTCPYCRRKFVLIEES